MNMTHMEKLHFIGSKGLKSLSSKTVTIIGLGGIGSTLSQILVRNGVNLRIVDRSRVDEKDVARQTLYIQEDVTKFKAKQAKKRLEEINKDIKIKSFHEDLHEDNLFLLEADIIVDTSNDMTTSLLVEGFTSSKKITTFFANYSGEKGNVYLIKGKQPTIKKMQEELTLEPVKKNGAFSPLTTTLAGILAGEIMKELVGESATEGILRIDLLAGEFQREGNAKKPAKKVLNKTPTKKASKKDSKKTVKKVAKKVAKKASKTRSSKTTSSQKRKVSSKTTKKSSKKTTKKSSRKK